MIVSVKRPFERMLRRSDCGPLVALAAKCNVCGQYHIFSFKIIPVVDSRNKIRQFGKRPNLKIGYCFCVCGRHGNGDFGKYQQKSKQYRYQPVTF